MKELLRLARQTLETHFTGKKLHINEAFKKKYSDKRACFITLTENGDLRGCIGSLSARQELWKDVVENAKNAAFDDPRFPPLEENELGKIKIEISVLTEPKKLDYKNSEDLKNKIKNRGVVLKKGYHSATYLPQVWEQLPDAENFLSSLCEKAGLSADEWKRGVEILIYDAEKITE